MADQQTKPRGIEPGQVYDVAGLAGQNEDSIVSRTLVNADSGSLTMFAFAQGQKLSEHTCPYDALAHVLEGEAEIVLDGNPVPVRANQMLLMPAHVPHAVHATERFTMLLTMFKAQGKT